QTHRLIEPGPPSVEWLVLDAEAINDIDTTGAEALEKTIGDAHKQAVTVAVARAHSRVRGLLRTYGLLDGIGEGRLYATNRDAVDAFRLATDRGGGVPAAVAAQDDVAPGDR